MDEVAEGIFIGTESDAGNEAILARMGIDIVISLTHSNPETGDVPRVDFPMRDGPRNQYEVFAEAVQAVVARRERGDWVLLHCSAGASRSPSVAAAAMTSLSEYTLTESFNQILNRRSGVDPHDTLVRHAAKVAGQTGID